MSTATIIGSGPNGLSAAIVLAASGVKTVNAKPSEWYHPVTSALKSRVIPRGIPIGIGKKNENGEEVPK
jgi:flavin-dependent dehydrogenase